MKNRVIMGTGLLLTLLIQSCNSCEENKDIPPSAAPPEVEISSTEMETSDNAASTNSETTFGFEDGTSGNATELKARTQKSPEQTTSTKKAVTQTTKKKYSAPNGTDAENHDGDYYTKHDTTSMPTGSIK